MLSRDPRPFGGISRRRVLIDGSRGLALLAVLGAATTACGNPAPPEPDPLEQQAELARHDSELAAAAAKTAPSALAPALTELAAERGKHATALAAEVARLSGKPASTTTSTAATTTTSASGAPAPTVADVVAALRSSADSATSLAPTLSGYRAGLIGSIAASCVTGYSVALSAGKAGQ
ncbi:membrane protein [Mycolicibacterium aromaticivorans JS19b1 = JCM 16368]|uniref:Membrane protein n=1 Tax=Mycolicibacterium aromaticivorans JS19b1 = JCM 16368 TaxID=1440774 RepID=A0A064CGM8_9MYCO|nr:membrane protein [Mycolicibacterium aromaticivorans]KDE97932.1 membrane protein [Mycolicibacterium aromaticivorans JS19b1 = JCM 16368]